MAESGAFRKVLEYDEVIQMLSTLMARLAKYEEAFGSVRKQQEETLRWLEGSGFVFDNIGNDPGNWQHIAFRIYTDLCKVETIASAALSERES